MLTFLRMYTHFDYFFSRGGAVLHGWNRGRDYDVCMDDLVRDAEGHGGCLVYSFVQRLVRKEKEKGEFERDIARFGLVRHIVIVATTHHQYTTY